MLHNGRNKELFLIIFKNAKKSLLTLVGNQEPYTLDQIHRSRALQAEGKINNGKHSAQYLEVTSKWKKTFRDCKNHFCQLLSLK